MDNLKMKQVLLILGLSLGLLPDFIKSEEGTLRNLDIGKQILEHFAKERHIRNVEEEDYHIVLGSRRIEPLISIEEIMMLTNYSKDLRLGNMEEDDDNMRVDADLEGIKMKFKPGLEKQVDHWYGINNTVAGISTDIMPRNPTRSFSSRLSMKNLETVVASIPTIHDHHQRRTTKDPPISTQHSQNQTDATVESFVSQKDSEVHRTKESPMSETTPKDQNEEKSDSFVSSNQDKSTLIDYQQQGINLLPSSVTTSPVSLNISSEFPDLFNNVTSHDHTVSTPVNETVRNMDFKLKPEFSTERNHITLINQNLSETTDDILIENRTESIQYVVIVPRICSNKSVINRLLHLLNSSPNSKRAANFSCEKLKDTKIAIKSKQLFHKINEFLKAEAKTDDMVLITVIPNATLSFEILPQSSFDGVHIPKLAIIIIGAILLWVLVILTCVYLYKKCCQRHSTSLDLHHMPHLNLKADYNLTPIPRPSISFPDSNRDFLHAYGQDNYNLSRRENTLNKRNSSCSIAKTYEEVDKEICSKQEMSTFTMSSGKTCDIKASTSQDYGLSHTWDRLQEKYYSKKYGVDNPGYKK